MPGSYVCDSSWPVQTFQIAEGLRNHGLHALARELDRRVVRVVEESRIYPEYVRGDEGEKIRLNERIVDTYDAADRAVNRREQPPQQIQLWTLTAYGAIQYRRRTTPDQSITPTPFEEEILANVTM
jgi:hypothetical protein